MAKNFILTFFLFMTSVVNSQCLTLHETIQIALADNPAVEAAAYGIAIAEEGVGIAKAPYYPTLEAYAGYSRWQRRIFLPKFPNFPGLDFRIPTIVGPVNDISLGVKSRYTIYDSGRRRAQLNNAIAQRGVMLYEMDRVNQEIAFNISVAYYNLLTDLELEEVAKKQFERTENHLWIAKQRRETGDVPLVDVYYAEVEVANAKQSIIHVQAQVDIDRGLLSTLMGLPPNSCVNICRKIGSTDFPFDLTVCEAFEQAVINRPELKASEQRLEGLYSQVKEAQSNFGPKIYAEGSYGWRDDQFFPHDKEWLIGINAEWTLFQGYQRLHNFRQAQARLNQEEANYESLSLQVQKEVWESLARVKETYQAIETIEVQIKSAEESLRLMENRYEVGASTLSDLKDVQTTLTQVEADYVDAQGNYLIALISLYWSQGLLLEYIQCI